MSTAVRQALAAAATTVDGVKCSPYFRQSSKPGDAFVRLDSTDRDDTGFGRMVTWQVAVVVSTDLASAEKWIDQHLPALVEALDQEGHVTTALPVQLALATGTVPALIVTVIRAQE